MTRVSIPLNGDGPEGCKGCGACCNPVALPWTQRQIAMMLPSEIEDADRQFVLNDLTPLRYRDGLAAAPYLKDLTTFPTTEGPPEYVKPVFYSCRHFDPVEKACTNYENRPPVCRAYPLYGREEIHPAMALPEACVYR